MPQGRRVVPFSFIVGCRVTRPAGRILREGVRKILLFIPFTFWRTRIVQMTQKELQDRVDLHQKWLNGEEDGERLILTNYDLSEADLRGANLQSANFHMSNLRRAWLRNADLRDAVFTHANLHGSSLCGADLRRATLDYSSGLSLHYFNAGCKVSLDLIYQYLALFCTFRVDEKEQQEFDEFLDKIPPNSV